MTIKKKVFMPGNSFADIRARLSLQPSMIPAECGICEGYLDAYAPSDSECASITYSCYECELAWDADGRPQNYEEGGI